MLDSWLSRALAVVALAAAALALAFWMDGKMKAARIDDLEGQVKEQSADAAALRVLAERRPAVEIRYRDGLAAVNAAAPETSDACLTDPRIVAAYAVLGVHHEADAPAR